VFSLSLFYRFPFVFNLIGLVSADIVPSCHHVFFGHAPVPFSAQQKKAEPMKALPFWFLILLPVLSLL